MPSGPKKRRAARRRRGSGAHYAEDEMEDAVEVSESLSNIPEKSSGEMKAEAGTKGPESVDQINGLESPPTVDVEIIKEDAEGVNHGAMDGFSVVKEGEEISKEGVPLEEATQAIVNTVALPTDQSISQVNVVDTFMKDAQDSPSSLADLSPDHEGEVVKNDDEDVSMEGVSENPFEEPIVSSTHEPQDMVKTIDRSMLKEEAQDSSVPVKPGSETNVEMSLKDGQDSLENSSQVDVLPVEDHGDVSVVKEFGEDMSIEAYSLIESSSHEPQETVKTLVQTVLNKEAQDPSADDQSVIEVDVETVISFEDSQDSFETPLGSPSSEGHVSPIEGDVPFKGNWIEAVDVQSSLKDIQDSIKEPLGDSSIDDASPVVGVVKKTEYSQVGDVELVLKEDGDISMEGVVKEKEEKPLEELIEVKAVVKSVYQWVLNVIPSTHHAEDPFVPIKSHPETSIKDVQDSSIEPLHEDEDEGSVMKEDEEMPMKDVIEEPQTMVRTVDQLVMEKEAEEPFVQDKSVIEVNVDTSLKDAQDSIKEPPKSSSMVDISSVEDVDELGKVGESAGDDSPTTVLDHVESDVKENEEEILMEGIVEEPFVQGNECGVGECACDYPLVNFVVSVGDEKMSLEGVCEDPTGNSSHGFKEMVDITDQSISLKEIEDPSELVNVDTSMKDVHDDDDDDDDDRSPVEGLVQGNEVAEVGESECHGLPVMVDDVESVIKEDEKTSMESFVDEPLEELLDVPSHDQLVKSDDELDLKAITLEEDLGESVIEENIETPSKDAQEYSFKVATRSSFWVNVSPVEDADEGIEYDEFGPFVLGIEEDDDDDDMSSEEGVVLEDPTSLEVQEIVKAFDQSNLKEMPLTESVSVTEVNIQTFFEDSLGSPNSLHKVTFISENVHLDSYGDERSSRGARVMVVLKKIHFEEAQDSGEPVIELDVETSSEDSSSIESNVEGNRCEGPFEELTKLSLDEIQAMMKTVDLSDLNPSVPAESVSEENKEPLESTLVVDMSIVEGIVHGKEGIEDGESAATVNLVDSVIKEDKEISIESVLEEHSQDVIGHEPEVMIKTVDQFVMKEAQDPSLPVLEPEVNVVTPFKDSQYSLKEPLESPSLDDVSESPLEGVVQDPFEESSGISSQEPQEMVKTVEEAIKMSIDTSFEGSQDSFETPLGSPSSVGQVSPIEGFAEWKEKIGDSSQVMIKTADQMIPLEETQEPSLPVESVIESKVETPLKDDENQSSMESLGSFSMDDVSSMKGVVQGNEYAEVGERSFHGQVVSMEGDLEEPLKEPIKASPDELQTVVKTVDQSFLNPFVPVESDFEENLETSLNDNQVSIKEPKVISEDATMVNHVEAVKENEDLLIEGVAEEYFKEPIEPSSDDQQTTVDTIDMPIQKEILLNEATDTSESVKSLIEVNVETSLRDAQESEPLGTSSRVDVFPVEGIIHDSPVMANHGSSSLVNGSPGQRKGQRNEMVGLVRSLLEEIRRIRAFYEEGLRQTTRIDSQMLQVLEKFDSGP